MTLGEKLKEARLQFGWSQEALAERLYVSRAAIAKWETDTGIPDIANLKAISDLLQVSLDYLLDNGATAVRYTVREKIQINEYGKGSKKKKTDRAIRAKYPTAKIRTLLPRKKLTKGEKIVDNILGFLPFGIFGIPDILNGIKIKGNYYLLENNGRTHLALVTDTCIECRELPVPVTGKKFEWDGIVFTVCRY